MVGTYDGAGEQKYDAARLEDRDSVAFRLPSFRVFSSSLASIFVRSASTASLLSASWLFALLLLLLFCSPVVPLPLPLLVVNDDGGSDAAGAAITTASLLLLLLISSFWTILIKSFVLFVVLVLLLLLLLLLSHCVHCCFLFGRAGSSLWRTYLRLM